MVKKEAFVLMLIAVLVVFSISSVAAAQISSNPKELTDLAYSVQGGNSLYFSGQYQGKSVNMVRNGALGSGKWTIYTGTMTDRVRLTIDDKKGLQEMLSMDKGHRITVNRVGQERIEYRLYAPDRSYIIGSVLYKDKKRWLQGLMKTEAFAGYAALINVTDVTKQFSDQSDAPTAKLSIWLNDRWNSFSLVPTASAEWLDSAIEGFFSPSAQDARDRWSAPMHEMFKGALVGAGAFTVQLIKVSITASEPATVAGTIVAATSVVSAVVTAAPFIAAVGVGVTIGVAADNVRNWADSHQLNGSTSVSDLYNRLVAETQYSNEPAPEVPQPSLAGQSETYGQERGELSQTTNNLPENSKTVNQKKLLSQLDLIDQLDALDHQDFLDTIVEANTCTKERNFDCSVIKLKDAAKEVNNSKDKNVLLMAQQNLDSERKTEQLEREAAARERIRLAEEERLRQQQEAEQRRREQENQQASNEPGFGTFLGGLAAGKLGMARGYNSSQQTRSMQSAMNSANNGNAGEYLSTTKQINSEQAAARQTQLPNTYSGNSKLSNPTGPTLATQNNEAWVYDETQKDLQTGQTSSHHGDSISGSQMRSDYADRSSVEASSRGRRCISYSGSISSGKVTFVTITDGFYTNTFVFTRVK